MKKDFDQIISIKQKRTRIPAIPATRIFQIRNEIRDKNIIKHNEFDKQNYKCKNWQKPLCK